MQWTHCFQRGQTHTHSHTWSLLHDTWHTGETFSDTQAANHTPGVNLAQGDVEPLSNVLHRLVALGDDAHTFSDGFGCDGVVSSDHDHLKHRERLEAQEEIDVISSFGSLREMAQNCSHSF